MAISFTGSSNKVTFPASNIDLESQTKDFSVSCRFRMPTSGTFNRIVHTRDGDGTFVIAANGTDAYFAAKSVTANAGGFSTGRSEDYSGKHTGLTPGNWYHMTATMVNLYGVLGFDLLHYHVVSQVNGSVGIQDAQEFGIGDDTDEICFGSRCRTGTTTQSENDDAVAELAIWEDYLLTSAERTALENGASPLTIAPHKLKSYIPLYSLTNMQDLISGFSGTDAGTSSPTNLDYHPNVSLPVGANLVIVTPAVATGTTLTADTQSYTLTGNAATFTKQSKLVADTQAYVLTGIAADMLEGRRLMADTQSYNLTGNVTTFDYKVVAGTGAFTLTGIDASLGEDLALSSDDFDSAVFDTGASSIANADTATPTVTLVPNDQSEFTNWLQLTARLTGANGKTPTIEYDMSANRFSGTHKPVWKYLTDGRNEWKTFDNSSQIASIVSVSNNTAFTGDIEFSVKPRWHFFDTVDWVSELDSDPNVHELASSVAATSLAKHVHAQYDPVSPNANTVTSELTNMYGLRISNDAASPTVGSKWPVILLSGAHPQEDQGNYFTQQFVEYLLSGAPLADTLLQNFDFFWYDVNPTGRKYGRERFFEGSGTGSDANRAWDGSPTGTPVADIITALGTDIPGQLKGLVDMHGGYNLVTPDFGAFFDSTTPGSQSFYSKMSAKVTGGYSNEGLHPVGSSSEYGENQGAVFSATHEIGFYTPGHPVIATQYDQVVIDMAETMDEIYSETVQILTADQQSYVLTGNNAAMSVKIAADSQSYTLTGNTVELLTGAKLTGDTQSFGLTGNEATFDFSMAAVTGQFTLTGIDVSLQVPAVILTAETGDFTLTGNSILSKFRVPVTSGQFTFSGIDSDLVIQDNEFVGFWGTSPGAAGNDMGFYDPIDVE